MGRGPTKWLLAYKECRTQIAGAVIRIGVVAAGLRVGTGRPAVRLTIRRAIPVSCQVARQSRGWKLNSAGRARLSRPKEGLDHRSNSSRRWLRNIVPRHPILPHGGTRRSDWLLASRIGPKSIATLSYAALAEAFRILALDCKGAPSADRDLAPQPRP